MVPTAEDFIGDKCMENKKLMQPTAGTAWVLARVTTPDGTPIKGVEATIYPKGVEPPQYVGGAQGHVTGTDGLFQNCKLALGSTVQIWVRRNGGTPQVTVVDLTEKLTVVPIVWRPER